MTTRRRVSPGAREALLAKEYELAAKRRDYACPHCKDGRLIGHVCRPKTPHVVPDRYLAPMLVHKVDLSIDDRPAYFRSLSRFNVLICPRCYMLIEGPPQLQNGEVVPDRHVKSFYARTDGRLAAEEGGSLFSELFWARMHANARRMTGTDWYAPASARELIAERFVRVFAEKRHTFNVLIDSILSCDDPAQRATLLYKTRSILVGGAANLIAGESYRLLGALFAFYEFRLAQYAVMIGREAQRPFVVRPEGDVLADVARWLLDLLIARHPVPRATTGHVLMWTMRMRRFAPDRERLRWVRVIAWLATEHLIRKGQISYNDATYNPDSLPDNNEAVRYLNLVLRRDLDMLGVKTKDKPAEIRSQLTYGLNRCYQFSQGNGTPLQLRAWRLGEQVAKLTVRYLPDEAADLINQVGV